MFNLKHSYIFFNITHSGLPGLHESVTYRGGGFGGVQHPPTPKFLSFDKAEPNSRFHGKYICNNLIRIWVSSTEFVDPPPQKKNPGYATVMNEQLLTVR
jgi:hypothetical protein